LRFRQQHPDHAARDDSRWAGFIHRWADRSRDPQDSGGNGLNDRLMLDRKIDR